MKIYTIMVRLRVSCIWTYFCQNGYPWTTREPWVADDKAREIADQGVYCVRVCAIDGSIEPHQYITAELSDGSVYTPALDEK